MQERFTQPIKQMIKENPSFGYRTVAYLLNFNKNIESGGGVALQLVRG